MPTFENKGEMQNCSRYTGIELMSHDMEVWERLVEERWERVQ